MTAKPLNYDMVTLTVKLQKLFQRHRRARHVVTWPQHSTSSMTVQKPKFSIRTVFCDRDMSKEAPEDIADRLFTLGPRLKIAGVAFFTLSFSSGYDPQDAKWYIWLSRIPGNPVRSFFPWQYHSTISNVIGQNCEKDNGTKRPSDWKVENPERARNLWDSRRELSQVHTILPTTAKSLAYGRTKKIPQRLTEGGEWGIDEIVR